MSSGLWLVAGAKAQMLLGGPERTSHQPPATIHELAEQQ
jgi:hypothetical protein